MVKKRSKKRGRSAAFMRSINPYLKSRSRKRSSTKMKRRKNKSKRYVSSGLKPTQILVGGALYGAIRSYVDAFIKPITSKVPLGSIADEAALFGLSYIGYKKIKNKTIKSALMAGMAVEAARMGEAFRDGSAFGTTSNGASFSLSPTMG